MTTKHDMLSEVAEIARMRDQLDSEFQQVIVAASEAGISQRAIGEAAGLTHARIGQIVRQNQTHS